MTVVSESRALHDPVPTPPAVARTYQGNRDGWERVLEYERVAEYASHHPDKGSGAVASALDLPRSRIRTWVDSGGAPDPVHGLRTALDRRWLVPESDRKRRRALAVCVAWISAGGSIAGGTFAPRFSAQTDAERERIRKAAVDLGITLDWVDRDAEGQGIEGVPSSDASVFGRVLAAAGAPIAPSDTLPEWILDGPEDVRRAVAAAYVECRGQRAGHGELLQVREEAKTEERLKAIGELLSDVAGRGTWTLSGEQIRLDREGTDALLETLDVEV